MTTTQSDSSHHPNNPFSSFTVGVALGVVAALLFGTEEGRKLVKKAVDAIPDKYKTPPIKVPSYSPRIPLIPTEETPHHMTTETTTFTNRDFNEAPPPPAPHVQPVRPEPFTPNS